MHFLPCSKACNQHNTARIAFVTCLQGHTKEQHSQEIPSVDLNELFCVPLYTDYLSDLQEKFQVASVYDTNVE